MRLRIHKLAMIGNGLEFSRNTSGGEGEGIHKEGAVLYDYFEVNGGAESVTLTMAECLDAAICIAQWNPGFFIPTLLKSQTVVLGPFRSGRGLRDLISARRFARRTRFLSRYDWVIYSGATAPCAIHNRLNRRNILYVHALPRFAYDMRGYWLERARLWERPVLRALIWLVKRRYEAAIPHMDVVISNSRNVRGRVLKYLGRDSVVIHPPCHVERFSWIAQENFYLSTSRVEPYKRVRAIVQAFVRMPEKKLVVLSGGSELDELMALAGGHSNIRFTGWLAEEELADLMGRAIATLYIPIDEDFGMSPVESMAAGKPVIGVAEGGLLETVVHEQTGLLLPPDPSVEDIIAAVNRMTPEYALSMRQACEERAQLFSKEVFIRKMKEVIGIQEPEGA